MTKKKVVLVISYLFPNSVYPGFGIFVFKRLKAVSKYKNVMVINPVPWFPFSRFIKRYRNFHLITEKEVIDGLEVYHPRFFVIPGYFKFLDSITFLISVLPLAYRIKKKFELELVDIHWTYPDILSGHVLSKLCKVKYAVTIRGKAALNIFLKNGMTNSIGQEFSIRTLILNFFLRRADSVICVSKELADLSENIGVSSKRIQVISNGVDPDTFYRMDKELSREKLGLELKRPIILSVGNLIYGKGFDRVLSAMKDLPDLTYYIAGSTGPAGDYEKQIRLKIKDLCLESRVVLLGQLNQDELRVWYNAADLFCLPSRSEGSPNVLNEALACGCPCLATCVGTVPQIIDNEKYGLVVSNSAGGIQNGLSKIQSMSFNREEIAQNFKRLSWDRCAQDVVGNYAKICPTL